MSTTPHPGTRRQFLQAGAVAAGGLVALRGWASVASGRRPTDVRIGEVRISFEDFVYRAPVKFAGAIMDRATVLTVRCRATTPDGQSAEGVGYMPFNHIFSYPSKSMSHEAKNDAMKALAHEIARVTERLGEHGHPLDLNWLLAPEYLKAAAEVSARLKLPDPIPKLCTLVTAAAFDAAIHDAYGKRHGVSVFATYNAQFMGNDLSRYLGAEYKGRYPGDFLLKAPKPRMPLCHMISAVDPIEAFQNSKPLRDGLPETMPEWIAHNGLIEFKIKVNGDDLAWDIERVAHIDRVVRAAQEKRGVREWFHVLDFNEKCPDLDYFTRFLEGLKAKMGETYSKIRYVEQPTARDLRRRPPLRMHAAAKLCPVVIDESLVDVESLLLAKELGWTGAVVKSPKGLSAMLLITSVAGKENIYLAGGDMSCPGGALVQTANFQARVPTITSVEANVRQFFPAGNTAWEPRYPGIFRVKDGLMKTGDLTGPGLGA
ncbi:MAG TPA: enolase C-terminal domain-like protein [Opitutaceae bacterium]